MTVAAAVEACLSRIAESDPNVQAWTYLDPDAVRATARELDALPAEKRGPLHGRVVGIKDIVDVAGWPCANGTELDAGRVPTADADCVAALKQAGALILGKTVTTELAYFSPGKTRNPHDATRTPGGSSSGSAAAVGAGMVPLAVGSQTNGSVVRPAAFCGVVGFKPTRGVISTKGAVRQAQSLDTLGSFALSVEDVALMTDVMAASRTSFLETCRSEPPSRPRLALVRTPVWDMAESSTQSAFEALAASLGADEIVLPPIFEQAHAAHRHINMAELAQNFAGYARRGREQLSGKLQEAIDLGNATTAPTYLDAVDLIEPLNEALAPLLAEYDALLTPSAAGEAPSDLTQTGNPAFCTMWTLCGMPAITLPHLKGPNGMPIGTQLVAARGDDGRLLRTARWLENHFNA